MAYIAVDCSPFCTIPSIEGLLDHEEYGEMNDQVLKLYEASKALMNYIDSEDVFDKVGSMGCGGVDHHQSETFYDLIAAARIALKGFEKNMKP